MQCSVVSPSRHTAFTGISSSRKSFVCKPCRHTCTSNVLLRPMAAMRAQKSGTAETMSTTRPANPREESVGGKFLGALKTAAKAAAIMGVALALVLGNVNPAHAARSAGRAGGFYSPAPSYGGGGMSRGYSGGYSSGYSGGYSSGYSGGYSSGYSGRYSRGYSGGYSSGLGLYSAPSTYSPSVVAPAPPVLVPGTSLYSSPGVAVVRTGPAIVDLAIVTLFVVIAVSAAPSMFFLEDGDGFSMTGGRPTLTCVQVGLVSLARELKCDLDHIASRADTSDARGLHHLLQEVVLALLRNPSYCIYGAASQQTTDSISSVEAKFNKASVKERTKFEQETLVNVAGAAPRRSSYKPSSRGSSKPDELIVVTLLVATRSGVKMPSKINSVADLKEALGALGSVPQKDVLGVELMWTPQAEGDYYTKEEIISDYPNLRQL